MRDALGLYWWRKLPNFGDAISQIVVAHAAGRDVCHAKPKVCDLFAVGSIMNVARNNHLALREDDTKPWIWGTGCIGNLTGDFLDNVQVALLRGPMTAKKLGIEARGFGDPGLLIADAMGEEIARSHKVGLVLHHSHLVDPALVALADAHRDIEMIDVRSDPREVCRAIAACRFVVSSSLHGLVVADSFGVPNRWLDPTGIHRKPEFKFLDYAAGIGRKLDVPILAEELAGFVAGLGDERIGYQDGIERSKCDLMTAFPQELKQERMQ